eukprot:1728419-Pleurochrysis_carterae.AAC.2
MGGVGGLGGVGGGMGGGQLRPVGGSSMPFNAVGASSRQDESSSMRPPVSACHMLKSDFWSLLMHLASCC